MAPNAQSKRQHPLEQLAKLDRRVRLMILAGVFLALVGVYWSTLYSGTLTGGGIAADLKRVDTQLAGLQEELAESRSIASNMESFEAKHEELKTQLDRALQRLPNEKELPVLLTDISSLGKKSGLEFRSFRPEPEVSHGLYAEVPIRIEFLGSYHEVGMFFDRLSKLSRIVNITNLEMKHEDSQADPPQLVVTGTATTFRFVEEASAKKGGV